MTAAKEACSRCGINLPITPAELRKLLKNYGKLVATEQERGHLTVRRTLAGKRREVVFLDNDFIFGDQAPENIQSDKKPTTNADGSFEPAVETVENSQPPDAAKEIVQQHLDRAGVDSGAHAIVTNGRAILREDDLQDPYMIDRKKLERIANAMSFAGYGTPMSNLEKYVLMPKAWKLNEQVQYIEGLVDFLSNDIKYKALLDDSPELKRFKNDMEHLTVKLVELRETLEQELEPDIEDFLDA